MVRCPPALIALALVLGGGCASDELAVPDPLLVIAGPEAFERLELRDAGEQVIWRLVADEPAALSELVYGEVPAGFRQEVPARGGPRSLLEGEPLTLESVTPLRRFRHEGFVASHQRFSIDRWEMRLRYPPDQPALDGGSGAS